MEGYVISGIVWRLTLAPGCGNFGFLTRDYFSVTPPPLGFNELCGVCNVGGRGLLIIVMQMMMNM